SSKMLSAILIGNNIVNISCSALATTLTIRIWGDYATGIATGILTVLVLIFGEITPKTAASAHSEKIALFYAPIIRFLMIILTPVINIVDWLSSVVMKLFHIDLSSRKKKITEDELRTFVKVSHEDGVIEKNEKQIITNVFDFGDSLAKDVMIPRIDMTLANVNSGYNEIIELFRETKYTRIPIYEDNADNVVGILNIKDLILNSKGSVFHISSIMRKPFFTFEQKNTAELFKEMQYDSTSIAIVLDEYGSTAGMITTEDLLEEIVGEIRDEYDEDEKEPYVKLDDGTYMVEGSLKLDDLNELLMTSFSSEDNDSIGGLIIEQLDRMPEVGDCVEINGYILKVEAVSSNRVESVKITSLK
ncbi:MAG: hemolysin family protein, partial [Eubacteriales bacterium]|nr:hemolysin family protein [Eubacteriales bacterium]